MLHLRDKDRKHILKLAKQCITEEFEIWAFGSRVKGTSHDMSDLDLVIRTNNLKAISVEELSMLKEEFTKSSIPITIEIMDWAQIPESFRKNILEAYEVL